ncbi:MAG TPA: trigger factor [bacterium]|nr:trigger factor [bacterium]
MQTKIEKFKGSKVKITVKLSPEEMLHHIDHAYEHIAPTVKLPGFRPGKAPRALIESTVGVSRIMSDALDMAINDVYFKVLSEHKLTPVGSPNIVVNKYPTYGKTAEEVGQELELELEVSTFPEPKIGDYSKVRVSLPARETVKKEDVERIIDNLRKQKSDLKDIERAAQKGDFVDISYEGSQKGVKIDQMSSKAHPMVIGDGTLIPGFEDNIVGMKKGEEKEFELTFPKDYHSKDHAGKKATFKVKLNTLKEVELPAADDKLAESFGEKTFETLKSTIEKNLDSELERKFTGDVEQKVLDAIIPKVEADIPEVMIEKEIDRILSDYRERLEKMGLHFDSYLESLKKTTEDLRKEMRETAIKNIKVGLLLGEIIKEQKIDQEAPDAGKKAINFLVDKLAKK